jgi:5-methylcytosine-specific restriction endonuclease McrA
VADYLQYWVHSQNAHGLIEGEVIEHTAGNQLRKVTLNDVIWIVTLAARKLILVGPLSVGWVGDTREARRRLRTSNLWDAEYHAIARTGAAEAQRHVDITNLAPRLRFVGAIDRLPQQYSGQSLQVLRTLAPESARLLRTVWGGKLRSSRFPASERVVAQAREGTMIEHVRYSRGRSRRLRDEALRRADGTCEACARDFSRVLDGKGVRVLQVHHRKQLSASDAPRVTHVDDLAVLCANCHALVHMSRILPLQVEQLRVMLQKDNGRLRASQLGPAPIRARRRR